MRQSSYRHSWLAAAERATEVVAGACTYFPLARSYRCRADGAPVTAAGRGDTVTTSETVRGIINPSRARRFIRRAPIMMVSTLTIDESVRGAG
jgi:hypothetical protein